MLRLQEEAPLPKHQYEVQFSCAGLAMRYYLLSAMMYLNGTASKRNQIRGDGHFLIKFIGEPFLSITMWGRRNDVPNLQPVRHVSIETI